MVTNAEDIRPHEHGDDKQHVIVIHIDRKRYETHEEVLTGAQIRRLANPDIGPEFDLWQDVPGGDDNLVGNDERITLRDGMHFYSAPSTINPG